MEEEEDICRFCRSEGTPDKPLYYPCKCTGSIKFIHQTCLTQWLAHSKKEYCELCNHRFVFEPVYSAHAPPRLPVHELVVGVIVHAWAGTQRAARLVIVAASWLLVMPYMATRIWRLMFCPNHVWAHPGDLRLTDITLDVGQGLGIAASMVLLFFALMAFSNFLNTNFADEEEDELLQRRQERQVREHRQRTRRMMQREPALRGLERGGQSPRGRQSMADLIREATEGVPAANQGAAPETDLLVTNRLGQSAEAPRSYAFSINDAEGPGPHLVDLNADFRTSDEEPEPQSAGSAVGTVAEGEGKNGREAAVNESHPADALTEGEDGREAAADESSAAEIVMESTGAMAPPGEQLPGHGQGHGDDEDWETESETDVSTDGGSSGQDDAGDDDNANDREANENDDPLGFAAVLDGPHEDVSLEELIGLSGPLTNLFENLFWTLLILATFVVAFALLPYMIGHTAYDLALILAGPAPPAPAPQVPNMASVAAFFSAIGLGRTAEAGQQTALADEADSQSFVRMEYIRDIPLGYVLVAGVAGVYLRVMAAVYPSQTGIVRMFHKSIGFYCAFVKVSILIGVELGVFPVLAGWWLDICTLEATGATFRHRRHFFAQAPVTSTFIHWLLGMLFMSHFASFAAILREEVRPGVLWFLRNPNDPNFQPVKEMVDQPLAHHTRRIAMSAVLYALIAAAVVHLPVRAATLIGVYPLNLNFAEPVMDVPLDLLLLHLVVPLAVNRADPRGIVKAALRLWLRAVATVLGVWPYLIGSGDPLPEPSANADAVQPYERPAYLPIKIVLLLAVAWMSAFGANLALAVLPIVIGRQVLAHALPVPVHDVYTFGVGATLLLVVSVLTYGALTPLLTPELVSRMGETTRRAVHVAGKLLAVGVVMCLAIPLAAGLLFELLLVTPLQVPAHEEAAFHVLQSWALGCVLLKIAHRAVLAGPHTEWRDVLEQMEIDGVEEFDARMLLDRIGVPLATWLLVILCTPYALAKALVHIAGLPAVVGNYCFRYGYLVWAAATVAHYAQRKLTETLRHIHDSVRDSKYLVRQQLVNHPAHAHAD